MEELTVFACLLAHAINLAWLWPFKHFVRWRVDTALAVGHIRSDDSVDDLNLRVLLLFNDALNLHEKIKICVFA
jgi:hypothetical protein